MINDDNQELEREMAEQTDYSVPSGERQAKLEAAYLANVAVGKPPYQDVEIRTRGELNWVIATRGWSVGAMFPVTGTPANLAGVKMIEWDLSGVELARANLTGVELHLIDLSHAVLARANLTGTDLGETTLSSANLDYATLSGALLSFADLSGASLVGSRMDVTTELEEIKLDHTTKIADVVWNGAPLMLVDWESVPTLGDEAEARRSNDQRGKRKSSETRLNDYTAAARAYRQLAIALRNQGLNEYANNYAYRAQLMQRAVLLRQAFMRRKERPLGFWYRIRKLTAYIGSWILWALAGYGYRPGRSILAYLLIVGIFAVGYHSLGAPTGHPSYHLSWLESAVVSLTAFHGRGFFAQQYSPGDPQSILAAGEAVVGLLIEITFIATFTNRFFAR